MKTLRWIGIVLAAIGIGGFFTVADDLRHTGELMGVGTIFGLGLIAFGFSFLHHESTIKSQHQR